METLAWLVLILPLAGSLISALGFRALPARAPAVIGTAAIAGAFACTIGVLVKLQDLDAEHRQVVFVAWDYAQTAGVDAKLSILIDPLSVFMMLVVTGVSTLIHLYSATYMKGDRGYARFFSYLNFFVFSMLVLVMAGNFFLLVVGWAFVGAASYLLISYWYRRTTATTAGLKAFVINVVGDVGLVLGTYFIFRHSGTLDFLGTFETAGSQPEGSLTAGCILLLVGAFAKSAQIPLHTWLPDAMEGPTPVSALIHAATMVTAGVYLIARMWPLFEQAPAAADVGAIAGCVTLLVAGTIGLVVTDLKRVIAYSTMSQIGYMIMAVSAGAYAAGLFHLMTHAFFKALLFMAAGSVIAAMAGEQSLDKMGGFRKAMPFTFGCFVIGGLALAGIPPFSGFFSKDEIITLVGERGGWHYALYTAAYVGSFLTAVYTWRMIFRAFWGKAVPEAEELEHGHLHHAEEHRNPATGELEDTDVGFPGPEHHIAERSAAMKVAMGLLAVGAIVGGLLQIPLGGTDVVDTFLEPTFEGSQYAHLHASDGFTTLSLIIGTVLAVGGIAVAYYIWVLKPGLSAQIQARFSGLHRLFANKWYFDELIELVIVRPFSWFGRFGQQTFERVVVDGTFVGGTTLVVRAGSAAVRALQSGLLRAYAALLVLGLVAVVFYFLLQS
ncbi:MAG TPA: NADH-quinone oxidoreductase subunit L [Solirubrobacteraceae bacterium]|nr:NADH-quinone oxidoreductase subunit L [Solirubrobacteraceae bacterium]